MSDNEQEVAAESPIQERARLDKEDLKMMQTTGEKTMDEDHKDTMQCVALFLNSQVAKSEKAIQSKYGKTLIHTHGTAVLAVLRAVLTFDQNDIDFAMDALKSVVEASSALRKEQSLMSSFSGMIFGGSQKGKFGHLKSMNRLQKHAEVIYAESYLLKALLSLLTEGNMVTFVKEGLAIRQSYQIFKSCYKFLNNIVKEEGRDGLKKNGIDSHFISAVYLGMGSFNLMLSILPSKLLRVFEVIGFGGHRDFGMQCLALCANWQMDTKSPITKGIKQKEAVNFFSESMPVEDHPGTRRFICDIMLTMYHVLLSTMIQLPGCNIPKASQMINKNLEKYPESFMYFIFKGKVSQAARRLEDAISEFNTVIDKQKDWRQLAHVCFWDIGLSYGALGEWTKAGEYFDTLFKENKWSPAIYMYLKAVMLYTADPVKNIKEVEEMMTKVPTLLKKVAGKSIPLEVLYFNCRNSLQGNQENSLFKISVCCSQLTRSCTCGMDST
jgi:tetratricopeptide (TPR) repeat protein